MKEISFKSVNKIIVIIFIVTLLINVTINVESQRTNLFDKIIVRKNISFPSM